MLMAISGQPSSQEIEGRTEKNRTAFDSSHKLTNKTSTLFSRSAERSELLIESEARSAESRSDVAQNVRRLAQADANLCQGFYGVFICIYINYILHLCLKAVTRPSKY